MGAFYRTQGTAPIDYMYQMNIPLMQQVISANDQYIDKSKEQDAQARALADFSHLTQDDEAAGALTKDYQTRADDITAGMTNDPANWRNYTPHIQKLQQDLMSDYKDGKISKYVDNFNRRQQAFANADKQAELWHTSGGTKGANPAYVQAFKNHWDTQFGGTFDKQTGARNIYQGGSVPDNIDFQKVMSDGLDKMKADKTKMIQSTPDNKTWLIDKVTGSKEELTPERIMMAGLGNVTPDMLSALKQYQDVGIYNKDMSIDPYKSFSYDKVDPTEEQQKQIKETEALIASTKDQKKKDYYQNTLDQYKTQLGNKRQLNWDNNNFFAPILRGLVNQFGYSNTEEDHELSNYDKPKTQFTQGQENDRYYSGLNETKRYHNLQTDHWKAETDRQLEQLKHTMSEDAIHDKQKDRALDIQEMKANKPAIGGLGGIKPVVKPAAAVVNPPNPTNDIIPSGKNTEFSQGSVNGLNSWMTTDPKTRATIPTLSYRGLMADVDNFKSRNAEIDNRVSQLNSLLAKSPNNQGYQTEKEELLKEKQSNTGELADRRRWSQQATAGALEQLRLNKDDANLYSNYGGDAGIEKLRKEVAKIQQQYPDIVTHINSSTENGSTISVPKHEPSPQAQEAQAKLERAIEINNKVKTTADNLLTQTRNKTTLKSAVDLSRKDSEDLTHAISHNPKGLELYDDNFNQLSSTTSPAKNGKYTMDFSGNSNIMDYLTSVGGKIVPVQISNNTDAGKGNPLVKVRIVDPTGHIDSKKDYYIEANDNLRKELSTKFSDPKYDPKIVQIGFDMNNDEANNLKKQLNKPSVEMATGKVTTSPEDYTINVTTKDGKKVPLQITRVMTNGEPKFVVSGQMNGQSVPLPHFLPNGNVDNDKIPGKFNSTDELINNLFRNKYARPQR